MVAATAEATDEQLVAATRAGSDEAFEALFRRYQDRIYTVMSGVFYIGLGERFDVGSMQAFPPGSVVVLPGDTAHFHFAKSGEYVTQVTAIGPLGLEYVEAADDPRTSSRASASESDITTQLGA